MQQNWRVKNEKNAMASLVGMALMIIFSCRTADNANPSEVSVKESLLSRFARSRDSYDRLSNS